MVISGLILEINDPDRTVELSLPPAHRKFSLAGNTENMFGSVGSGKLQLEVIDKEIPPEMSMAESLVITDIFEISEKPSGDLRFYAPRQIPPRVIEIDRQFQYGQVIGNFSEFAGKPHYPLQYIDIVLFSNWLASFGDVILHSAGVDIAGKGYCFMGKSGVGKSTLSNLLSKNRTVTLLGEDQVILRYLNGRFWIFGTPWHVNPEVCSPKGVPLEKIFFLTRNDTELRKAVQPAEGYKRILQNSFIPFYRKKLIYEIIKKISVLSEIIPFDELSFSLDSDLLNLIFTQDLTI